MPLWSFTKKAEHFSQGVTTLACKKPCIKLQYSGKAQSFSSGKNRLNIIEFKYRLDDFKSVTVHEEYLIFDSVAHTVTTTKQKSPKIRIFKS